MVRVRKLAQWARSARDRLTVQAGCGAIALGVAGQVSVWVGLTVGGVLAVAYGLLLVDDGEGGVRRR